MATNWRDIQERAVAFSARYADAKDEDRDAKPFWHDLFGMYGLHPHDIGAFEERVKVHGKPGVGKIDYFAPRLFIVEQKSRGKNLTEAYLQALAYFDSLDAELRPRYIITSDFEHIVIHDLEAKGKKRETTLLLSELPKNVKRFSFLLGEEAEQDAKEEPVDVKAVRAIGKLHSALKSSNYPPEDISRVLTRLVFCFFADDTGIFERHSLERYLRDSKSDGIDIGDKLHKVFEVLNTPDGRGGKGNTEDRRQTTLDPLLANMPYVNGGMFADPVRWIAGTRELRDTILACSSLDWSAVSPAIFGSMFQSVMDEKQRHDLGAHYTSEKNILKVIGPLFLEDLHAELEAAKTNADKLRALQDKLAAITLLDPACGCGNFLVVSYRELRRIENEIIARLHQKTSTAKVEAGHVVLPLGIDLKTLSKLSVERMYGIEIEPFPAEVAKLSLWLTDHLMNAELGKIFGKALVKLPLTEAPHIVQGNALRLDWETVVPKDTLSYILGNPPFLGSKVMSDEQRAEIADVSGDTKGAGVLDFVTGWYFKAAHYIQGTSISCAFVSTNSITQGEQVAILWKPLMEESGIRIQFAHRTFKWSNEATGKAAVHCVIVGFGLQEVPRPRLFTYEHISSDPTEIVAKHINPYLIDAPNIFLENRSKPLCDAPTMVSGNKPIDGGNYLFTPEQKEAFLKAEPASAPYFKRWLGGEEFLNGIERWYLFLAEISPEELRKLPEAMRRVEAVRMFRSMSNSAPTKKLADTPTRFHTQFVASEPYLAMPQVSSERRHYIPIAFLGPEWLCGDKLRLVAHATLYHFGVMTSEMHMTWTRTVCGRLKSDYQYSAKIVYNNFPWPENPSDAQKKAVDEAAQGVLDARAKYPNATLADLYDPNTMPADLLKAHKTLDRAVDACYGSKKFKDEPERLEFLFERYKELAARQ
jgi:hypothetical protein